MASHVISEEILNRVRKLEIQLHRLVSSAFSGEYHSMFRGQGMTFAEFREYVPGDDVRAISWPLTARTGKTYLKIFDEERELILNLLVDVSGSLDFGSHKASKRDVAFEISALMAFAAQKNRDQVGLVACSDRVELHIPPRKGRSHVQRILRDILSLQPRSHQTDLNTGIKYLLGVMKKRGIVVIVSDFRSPQFQLALQGLARKQTVLAIVLHDPMEAEWPANLGFTFWQNSESGAISLFNGRLRNDSSWLMEQHNEWKTNLEKTFKKCQVKAIFVDTTGPYLDQVVDFLRKGHR